MNLVGANEHGRVEGVELGHTFLVTHDDGRQWAVWETGQQWDAWPYPQCDDPGFDEQAYLQTELRGKGTATADEKIRELIGRPRRVGGLGP